MTKKALLIVSWMLMVLLLLNGSVDAQFIELVKIQASDKEEGDLFGTAVSISGNHAIVGAFLEDCGGTDAGAAYIFAVPSLIEHYLSYKTRITRGTTKFKPISPVSLADQLEDRDFIVYKPKSLYNPADKNDQGISDFDTHLVSYLLKPVKRSCLKSDQVQKDKWYRICETEEECGGTTGETKYCKHTPRHKRQTNIKVENQFGEIFVDTLRPDLLLVPSAKCIDNPTGSCNPLPDIPTDIDHFKCYKVRITKGTGKFKKIESVALKDQFIEQHAREPKLYKLLQPTSLCTPVEKKIGDEITPITNPDAHLMCYRVRQIRKVCSHDPSLPCRKAKDCGEGNDCIPQPRHRRLTGIYTNNQFKPPLQVDAIKEEELCVPSIKTVQPQ